MLVEITDSGMEYWDKNMPKTDYGEVVYSRKHASRKEKGLFVLGVLYGMGPDDPSPLIKQDRSWIRIIDSLVEDGYLRVVE